MANVYAVKSGNWSDTTVWNTGALPTSADDVYSNGFTVTVDISPTVLTVRNTSGTGINAGGSFTLNAVTLSCTSSPSGVIAGGASGSFINCNVNGSSSATINANITAGTLSTNTVTAVTFSGTGILTINGTVRATEASASNSNARGLDNTGTGTVTIIGDVYGGLTGNVGSEGVRNASSGIVNITGNVYGTNNIGSASLNNPGVNNASSGTVNITGQCLGRRDPGVINSSTGTININTTSCTCTATQPGAYNGSTGTINITGTCIGGPSSGAAYLNNSTGTINHTGSAIAGSTNAFVNNSTGTITHIGTAQASATAPAIGAGAIGQVTILTGPLLSTDASYTGATPSGVNPCVALRWFPADTALSTFEYRMRGQTVAGSPSARPARQMFLTNAYDATYPTAANVRSGTAYGPSSIYTGTCAVPAAASVVVGAAVDNTVGTAAITAATIRAAVGLASANLDTQLSGITSGISGLPSASAIASAVWSAATRTLTTAIDNSSTIAAAVWSYATGRTITGGTVDTLVNSPSVPSAAQIATQVRTELTPELARVANCATTQEVDDIVEGALS